MQALACLIGQPGRTAGPLVWLINGGATDAQFVLPAGTWRTLLDTAHPRGLGDSLKGGRSPVENRVSVAARSMLLLADAAAA